MTKFLTCGKKIAAALAGTGSVLLPSPASAQEAIAPPRSLEIDANAAIVSDYRFRGISLSDRRRALQGGVDLTTRSGWTAGAWASTIADYGGAEVEVDFYAGYARSVMGLDLAVGTAAYLYPGGKGVNYVEATSTIGRSFGTTSVEAELAYVPRQQNASSDNIYAGLTLTQPVASLPLRVRVRGGYEDGFYRRKWDWEAGVEYERGMLTASIGAAGSNHGAADEAGRLGRTGLVAGLSAGF